MADPVVRFDPSTSAYVVTIDDEPAGAAYVERNGDVVVFTHTEVDPTFEGKGVGSTLVAKALEDVTEQGLSVLAECPFVAGYLQRHPEAARQARGPGVARGGAPSRPRTARRPSE